MAADGLDQERVVAVVVTYNRCRLLAQALSAVREQSRPPDEIVVVDNASTDGTSEFLDRTEGIRVTHSQRNTGGAGGFAIGMAQALDLGADAVWLMDDDTVPLDDALEELCRVRRTYRAPSSGTDPSGVDEPVVVASRVVWGGPPDSPPLDEDVGKVGADHPMNTPRVKPGVRAAERAAAEAVGGFPIRSASFVSILVDARAIERCGLPIADYFLWNDDFEFTTRIIRDHFAVACPSSVAVHKTVTFGTTDTDPGDRFYYEVRNKVWMFGRSPGLSMAEKAMYGGSTLRRWTRTLAHSDDRRPLWRGLRRGLTDGVRRGPRDTEQIIDEAVADTDG
jgi:rhamnopyranosyl-N-acetylglucosaminyl-diphospho-decaprenol beta-1,3/1,4-galactofuranosyltransferase